MGEVIGVVFCRRTKRVVGAVLIPTLTACRKLAMCNFCGGKKINHVKIVMVWGCRFCLFLRAPVVLSSCYLIKSSLLYLGTVLTLLHGQSATNRLSRTLSTYSVLIGFSDQSEANILLTHGIFCEAYILLMRGIILFEVTARSIVGTILLYLAIW
jgi:hypothetical protein